MPGIGFVEQTYAWHCYVEQNLFLAYVMLDKTYSWIGYVRQNLFLAYVMLDKTKYGTYL